MRHCCWSLCFKTHNTYAEDDCSPASSPGFCSLSRSRGELIGVPLWSLLLRWCVPIDDYKTHTKQLSVCHSPWCVHTLGPAVQGRARGLRAGPACSLDLGTDHVK